VNTKPARQQLAIAASPWAVYLAGGALVIAALAAYYNSFSGPFIYDDSAAITENPTIRHLWPIWPALLPPPSLTTSGRPMVNLSLAVNYAFGGTQVWGYHALNLAIHILAGLTLFGIVRRTLLRSPLGEPGRAGPPTADRRTGARSPEVAASSAVLAFTVALIWTLHPLQTAAVTYTVQRAESLMGLFYLLTLYCFIRGTEGRSQESGAKSLERESGFRNPTSGLWMLASIFSCLLGMATKEVMVSAPLMVLFYDRTFVAGSFPRAWRNHRRLYLGLSATWLLLGYLVASTGGSRNGSAGFGGGVSWWVYALTQFHAIAHYLWLSLWPHPLVFDYGTAVVKQAGEVLPYALIIATLATATIIGLRRRPAIGFAGVWFFAILAPSSSVVPVATETMAEQRMYLPLAAVIALLVLGSCAWAGRRSIPVFLAFAILLGFITLRRNEDYSSALAIWSDTVAKSPDNARAHNQLGLALFQTGQQSEALQQYDQAVRLEPADSDGHYNLATALFHLGRVRESTGQFEEALRIKPDDAKTHTNFGLALAQLGRTPEAIGHYEEALRLNPKDTSTHNNLGIAFAQSGRMSEAIGQFEEALRIDPDHAETHNNLGKALAWQGRRPEAIGQLEEALRINPEYAEAHNNLGVVFDQMGRVSEAVGQYREVVRLEPNYADAHRNLGNDLAQLGQVQEAIGQLEDGLRLNPGDEPAQVALARLRALQSAPAPIQPSR
jgi:tetratricopeptide (TPR) repeat protein